MPRIKDGKIDKKEERRCVQRRRSRPGTASNAAIIAAEVPPPAPRMDPGSSIATPSPPKRRQGMDQGPQEEELEAEAAAMAADGHHVEKKRRLSVEQVKSLERHFEEDNKLEPERKVQLAQELGLQPRQVAVWFQNRRARWKTKQLERDYDALKESLDTLKGDYKTLAQEKQELEAEVSRLNALLSKAESGEIDKSDTSDRSKESESHPATATAAAAAAATTTSTRPPPDDAAAAAAGRKDCSMSSWDSDGSEIVDDDQITPRLDQSESGGGRFSLHDDDGDRVLMDTLECHIGAAAADVVEDAYAADAANSMVYSSSPDDRMIPKLEEAGYDDNHIFDLDEQGSLPWWDWA